MFFPTASKLNSRFFRQLTKFLDYFAGLVFFMVFFLLCGEPGQIFQLLCIAKGGGSGVEQGRGPTLNVP